MKNRVKKNSNCTGNGSCQTGCSRLSSASHPPGYTRSRPPVWTLKWDVLTILRLLLDLLDRPVAFFFFSFLFFFFIQTTSLLLYRLCLSIYLFIYHESMENIVCLIVGRRCSSPSSRSDERSSTNIQTETEWVISFLLFFLFPKMSSRENL